MTTTRTRHTFNGILQDNQYHNTPMLDFIGGKDDGGGDESWSYKTCKAPSHVVTVNKPTPNYLQAGCPFCRPTNSVRALKGKILHSTDLLAPSSAGVFQPCP